jgi:multidrug transporter EmrE-like cation transporter
MTTVSNFIKENSIYITILFIAVFESTAQVCLKKFKYHQQTSYIFLLGAVLLYIIVCGLLCMCYDKERLGKVNIMWSCISIICIVLFGYIFLEEKIKRNDMIAILLTFMAIYFANID